MSKETAKQPSVLNAKSHHIIAAKNTKSQFSRTKMAVYVFNITRYSGNKLS